jgi:hypothetical protein
MLDLIAAVNDDAILAANLDRSPLLGRPGVTMHLRRGFPSATLAYRDAMRDCHSDTLVFAHQDVYLPAAWEDQLMGSIAQLERADPQWAVLGVYGVRPGGAQVGCVWSSGLDAMFGAAFDAPVAVHSIDEVLIVLKRSSGVEFDAGLPGFHLYATDLVQTALSLGRQAYVIFAPVVHNSRPSLYLGPDYFEAYRHVARKWKHRLPIRGHVADIVAPGLPYLRMRLRHRLGELRYRHLDRGALARQYDCVTLARRLGFE